MSDTHHSGSQACANLKDQLLIAMPSLSGSAFDGAVIYLCEHNSEGAMGLIINSPLEIAVQEVFDQLEIASDPTSGNKPLLCGGPVSMDHGFVLHNRTTNHWQATLDISSDVSLTTSKDIVEKIAVGAGPEKSLLMLGYAGWGPGQLEEELLENAWLTVPSDMELLFETAHHQCAELAARRAGIEISQLSNCSGHA